RGANKVMFDPRMAFQYGPAPVIQPARLQALFLELVQIDSLSRREGRIAARLARELAELGAEVSFDGAGAEIGGETGNLIAHVPGAKLIEADVRGRAAHAGMAPERGVSAIQVAAEAIAAMRLGRLDPETTANIGVITGGRAVNIVPDEVRVRGEARSHDLTRLATQTEHMRACFAEAAARHAGAAAEVTVTRQYEPMAVPDDAPIMRLV